MASYRPLDLTLIGANFERRNIDHENMNMIISTPAHYVYAVATLSDKYYVYPRTEQRTQADKLGGLRNPTWNHTCRFFVPADVASAARLSIHVSIRAKCIMYQDIDIGESIIPLNDLLLRDNSTQTPLPASYVIRTDNQEPAINLHGILMISYKLRDAAALQQAARPVMSPFLSDMYGPMISPYASRYNNYGSFSPYGPSSAGYGSHGPYGSYGYGPYGTGFDGPGDALGRSFGADRTRMAEDAYNAGYVEGSRIRRMDGADMRSRI